MRSRTLFLGALLALGATRPVSAQFNAAMTVATMADDNVNNNADRQASGLSRLGVSAAYGLEMEGAALEFSYAGTYDYYTSVLYRTNQFHSIAAEYLRPIGTNDIDRLQLSAEYGLGYNRDALVLFDHSQFTAAAEYKHAVGERFIHRISYAFRDLRFPSLPDFSYSEHAVMSNGAIALSPSTTVIVQGDLGTKFYATDIGTTEGTLRKGTMASILPSVTQVTGMLKIGQGITEEIGVSLSTRYQWNIRKQTRYLSAEYGYLSDDELFDDHYGYEGFHTSFLYTHLLTPNLTGRFSAGVQERNYSTLPAYDLAGALIADQRRDTRSYLRLQLQQYIESFDVTVKFAGDLIDNRSNDAFYQYRNTAATLELTIPF